MGMNCYSTTNKTEDSRSIDIIDKVKEFLRSNNFYFTSSAKIYTYGQESLKIQSDEELENFLFQIIDHKEILRLLVVTIKKIMHLMNFSVRIKSIQNEDLPIIIIETLFLFLADPDRLDIQKEKFNIIYLLLNSEKSMIDKIERKLVINTRKFLNNINLLVNILYLTLFTYILLIVFLPNGQADLELYFENQEKRGLGLDDTIKWISKVIESIINENIDKERIIEKMLAYIEEPLKESILFVIIIFIVKLKNPKLFNAEEAFVDLDIELFYKVTNQIQFVFNPINLLEHFVLFKGNQFA